MKALMPFVLLLSLRMVSAQGLPDEMHFSSDGHILYTIGKVPDGLYEKHTLREVYLDFPQPNYWTLLTNNYSSETDIPATMTIDGVVYDSVGVRFRGNTSYFTIGNSQKKSFSVSTDFVHADQVCMGYKSLKFNNAHEDATFMREVLYNQMASRHTSIAKANYIHLYLNNLDWGIYPNIQSIDKTYLSEHFLSNDGARFRATTDGTGGGGGGGGGPGWGDGTAGLNYLGADTALYQKYYSLKSADIENPWQKLVDACQMLSTATVNNMDDVRAKIDIDKALWFLAVENVFTDDDSYVMKGKMDYYVYYEPETDRTFPLEYDGNSTFQTGANTVNWSPFKNATNVNYPLLNKLLNIPEWRQRYLAHYRTILNETFTVENATAIIDSTDAMIKNLVNSDPKKLYTYAQYTSGVTAMKTFVSSRRTFLLSNSEIAQVGPVISSAPYYNNTQAAYQAPKSGEPAYVKATVTSTNGISGVRLFYAAGVVGNFNAEFMYDDGLHEDGTAGDGVYGASIPGYPTGTWVRYYVEASADNAAKSVSFLPAGAEHDIFVYQVAEQAEGNGVVINEILASNTNETTDEAGEHEDWIELYNNNAFSVNLTGYYLTDDKTQPDKWSIPDGTVIGANGYLIIWADEDGVQGPLHSNFKLSASGEVVALYNASLAVVDEVTFGQQTVDLGYARVPNGTGGFVIQTATFNASNNIQPVTTGVVINEILAENHSGATDEAGEHEDWIELYNNNAFAVDLSGFYLSNNPSTLNQWQMPQGTVIGANGYLIIWADNEADGPLHASWNVSAGGATVLLSDTSLIILDSITFGAQTADKAFARVPNGTGGFLKQAPTYSASNNIQPITTGVVINEILTSNTTGATDEAGDFEDWVELYNNNAFGVDLSGFYVSDNITVPNKWQIPQGTVIAPHGYLIVWADDEAVEGPLHATWKLSSSGEAVIFSDTLLQVLDSVTFGVQTEDLAYARVPNGTGGFVIQATTFNANNDNVTGVGAGPELADFKVVPNPVTDYVWVIAKDVVPAGTSYFVTDLKGRNVLQGIWSGDSDRISVSSLPAGTYFLRLGNGLTAPVALIKL